MELTATLSFLSRRKPVPDLLERQVGLLLHKIEQPLRVRFEWRAAVTGAGLRRDATRSVPPVEPAHRRRGGEIEQPRHLPPALPLLDQLHRTRAVKLVEEGESRREVARLLSQLHRTRAQVRR